MDDLVIPANGQNVILMPQKYPYWEYGLEIEKYK